MTKLSKSSNPVFFNTARNLIHGELSLLPRHFVFPTVSHRGERETRTGDEAQGRRATLSGDTWPTISAGALFSNKRAAKVCICLCVIVKAN